MSGNDLSAAIVFFQVGGDFSPRVETYDALSTIAYGCAKLLLAVVVLAVLISLLVQALRDLGVRSYLQRRWVFSWLHTRAEAYAKSEEALEAGQLKDPNDPTRSAADEIQGLGRRASIFSLSPGQLCGQLSARVHSLFNDNQTTHLMRLLVFERSANDGRSRDEEAPQNPSDTEGSIEQQPTTTEDSAAARRLDRIERAIDDLQLYLDQRWRFVDYILGVVFAGVLIALSIAWARRTGAEIRSAPFTLYAFVSLMASLLVPQVRPVIERLTRPR